MCVRASWKKLIDPASMAESVKAGSLKRTTDGEGRLTEKKRSAYENITPENKAKIGNYAAENGIAGRLNNDR